MPGANLVNLAVYIGGRLRGIPGATAAFLGVTLPPFAIVLLVGWWYFSPYNVPAFHAALTGCAAGAVGLTLANAIELTGPEVRNPFALAIVTLTALAVGLLRLNLIWTLAIFGGAGIVAALLALRKKKAA
jgi:chromate transporter